VQSIYTNGWKIAGDDKDLNAQVKHRLDEIDWERHAKMATRDGYLCRWGIHEVAPLDGGGWGLVTRPSKDFLAVEDQFGNVDEYLQFVKREGHGLNEPIHLPASKAIQITPIPTSDGSGVSLIERAMRQVDWYYMISQSSADSIWRHGYPNWQVNLSEEGGKQVPVDIISGMEGVLTDKKPTSELVMNAASHVVELDKAGVPQVETYGNWTFSQLAAAMGVPELFFGQGHRSTEATATIQLMAFYDQVSTDALCIAGDYQRALLDPYILPELGAQKGQARLVFNNPNPQNALQKAQYCAQAVAIFPMDPVMTKQQVQAELGLEPDILQPSPLTQPLPKQMMERWEAKRGRH
jgi:hypothetical protein